MTKLNFHDYTVQKYDRFSSDLLNQISADFSGNMARLFDKFTRLVQQHNSFVEAVNRGLDWYTTQAMLLSQSAYTISPISNPLSMENIVQDKFFGIFYLQSLNQIASKIGRYTDSTDVQRAFESTQVYIKLTNNINDTWTGLENMSNLRQIIDNHNGIWQTYSDKKYAFIAIALPVSHNKLANIIDVVPFAGTKIHKISWKDTTTSYKTWDGAPTYFPVRIIGALGFHDEIRIIIEGNANANNYYFGMRFVDVYNAQFFQSGAMSFDIGPVTRIKQININSDYIDDTLKTEYPIYIKIFEKNNPSNVIHEFAYAPSALVNPIVGTGNELVMSITLKKVAGISPIIRYVDLVTDDEED